MPNNVNGNGQTGLKPNQKRALEALLLGLSYDAASTLAGVHERTLRRWREQPAFANALRDRSDTAIKDASLRLASGLETMLDVLIEIAENKRQPGGVRVRAALGWLNSHVRLLEVTEVLERLEALEAAINESDTQQTTTAPVGN